MVDLLQNAKLSLNRLISELDKEKDNRGCDDDDDTNGNVQLIEFIINSDLFLNLFKILSNHDNQDKSLDAKREAQVQDQASNCTILYMVMTVTMMKASLCLSDKKTRNNNVNGCDDDDDDDDVDYDVLNISDKQIIAINGYFILNNSNNKYNENNSDNKRQYIEHLISLAQNSTVYLLVVQNCNVNLFNNNNNQKTRSSIEIQMTFRDMVLNTEWTQVQLIHLDNDPVHGFGLTINGNKSTGVIIKTIIAGSPASRNGQLRVGDHLFQIDDVNVRCMSCEQVAIVLRQLQLQSHTKKTISFIIARSVRASSITDSFELAVSRDPNVCLIETNKLLDLKYTNIQRLFEDKYQMESHAVQEQPQLDATGDLVYELRVKKDDLGNITFDYDTFESRIFVSSIDMDAMDDGQLNLYDYVVKLNDLEDGDGLTYEQFNNELHTTAHTTDPFTFRFKRDLVYATGKYVAKWNEFFKFQPNIRILVNFIEKKKNKSSSSNSNNDGMALGITLEGTLDVECATGHETHPHHYIRTICKSGLIADTCAVKLEPGDELLEINNRRLYSLKYLDVLDILQDLPSNKPFAFVCARRHQSGDLSDQSGERRSTGRVERSRSLELNDLVMWSSKVEYIELMKPKSGTGAGLGFSLIDYNTENIVIRSLVPNGCAQLDGRLLPGQRLVSVNDTVFDYTCTLESAIRCLKRLPGNTLVRLGIQKPLPYPNSIFNLDQAKDDDDYLKCTGDDAIEANVNGGFVATSAPAILNQDSYNHYRNSRPTRTSSTFEQIRDNDEVKDEEQPLLFSFNQTNNYNENRTMMIEDNGGDGGDDDDTIDDNRSTSTTTTTSGSGGGGGDDEGGGSNEEDEDVSNQSLIALDIDLEPMAFNSNNNNNHVQNGNIKQKALSLSSLYHQNSTIAIIDCDHHHHQTNAFRSNSFKDDLKPNADDQDLDHHHHHQLSYYSEISNELFRLKTTATKINVDLLRFKSSTSSLSSSLESFSKKIQMTTRTTTSSTTELDLDKTNPNPNPDTYLTAKGIIKLPRCLEKEIKIKKNYDELGVVVESNCDEGHNGCRLSEVRENGAVWKDGRLSVGDYVLSVNNENMKNITNSTAKAILKRASLISTDTLIKYIPVIDANKYKEENSTATTTTRSAASYMSSSTNTSTSSLTHNSTTTTTVMKQHQSLEQPLGTEIAMINETGEQEQQELMTSTLWGQAHIVTLYREYGQSIGISIVGGKLDVCSTTSTNGSNDKKQNNFISGIFIKHVLDNSPAGNSGSLKTGDRILQVNGVDLTTATHDQAVDVIRNAQTPIHFLIQSLLCANYPIDEKINESTANESDFDVDNKYNYKLNAIRDKYNYLDGTVNIIQLKRHSLNESLGLSLSGNINLTKASVFICGIYNDTVAARSGKLRIGDQIIEINGNVLYGRAHSNVTPFIKSIKDLDVYLVVLRNVDNYNEMYKPNGTTTSLNRQEQQRRRLSLNDLPSNSTTMAMGTKRPCDQLVNSTSQQAIARSHNHHEKKCQKKITLKKGDNGFGMAISEDRNGCLIIRGINPNGVAFKNGNFSIGDEICAVDDCLVSSMKYDDVMQLLHKTTRPVTFTVIEHASSDEYNDNGTVSDELTSQTVNSVVVVQHRTSSLSSSSSSLSATQSPKKSQQHQHQQAADNCNDDEDNDQKQKSSRVQVVNSCIHSSPRTNQVVDGEETVIEIERGKLGLGLSIIGGVDTNIPSILIHDIYENGAAHRDKRLSIGDQILNCNGFDLRHLKHDEALNVLRRQTSEYIQMTILRPVTSEGGQTTSPMSQMAISSNDDSKYDVMSVDLYKKFGKGLGFSVVGRRSGNGVYISHLIEGGCAEKDSRLMIGDLLLEVNGINIRNSPYNEVAYLLKTLPAQSKVQLKIGRLKASSPSSASTSISSTPTTAQRQFQNLSSIQISFSNQNENNSNL